MSLYSLQQLLKNNSNIIEDSKHSEKDFIKSGKHMLNKVPEIIFSFWIIKILCTTVGETFADFLNTRLNIGLTGTSIIMGILLIIVLFFQFRSKKYTPSIYWLSVVLISIFGTLITDNLIDNFGFSLIKITIIFSIILALVFIFWYIEEKTLSIHSIFITKREVFYWLAILFTFALGTAAGDLVAEKLAFGYMISVLLFAGLITIVTITYYSFKFNTILAFWLAYILTRPLGASIGDYLSQSTDNGGLGLGTVITSIIFLFTILSIVTYLTISKKDTIISVAN